MAPGKPARPSTPAVNPAAAGATGRRRIHRRDRRLTLRGRRCQLPRRRPGSGQPPGTTRPAGPGSRRGAYQIWHDRAVFDFLTSPADRAAYLQRCAPRCPAAARSSWPPSPRTAPRTAQGCPSPATTLPGWPPSSAAAFGDAITITGRRGERHRTPAGVLQPFTWITARLPNSGGGAGTSRRRRTGRRRRAECMRGVGADSMTRTHRRRARARIGGSQSLSSGPDVRDGEGAAGDAQGTQACGFGKARALSCCAPGAGGQAAAGAAKGTTSGGPACDTWRVAASPGPSPRARTVTGGTRDSDSPAASEKAEPMEHRSLSPETLAAQALGEPDPASGGLAPVINPSTNYEQQPDGSYPQGRVYTRADNPTSEHAERLLAALEGGGCACALFASGMAAATAVFQSLLPGARSEGPAGPRGERRCGRIRTPRERRSILQGGSIPGRHGPHGQAPRPLAGRPPRDAALPTSILPA